MTSLTIQIARKHLQQHELSEWMSLSLAYSPPSYSLSDVPHTPRQEPIPASIDRRGLRDVFGQRQDMGEDQACGSSPVGTTNITVSIAHQSSRISNHADPIRFTMPRDLSLLALIKRGEYALFLSRFRSCLLCCLQCQWMTTRRDVRDHTLTTGRPIPVTRSSGCLLGCVKCSKHFWQSVSA